MDGQGTLCCRWGSAAWSTRGWQRPLAALMGLGGVTGLDMAGLQGFTPHLGKGVAESRLLCQPCSASL